MKKLLCKIYGHRTSGDEYLGQEYLTVHPETVDGIGRWHATIETECKRCGEVFRVGKIHIPQKLVNVDQRVIKPFRFVELPIPIDERVPEGYTLILAYAKDDDIVIPIADIPEESGELHDCDWEGCGTLDHVVRFSVERKYKAL